MNDDRTAIFFEGQRVDGPRSDFIDVDGGGGRGVVVCLTCL